ncbi:hypothetical protein [Streptomyces sp. NPDC021224]|uniref:hypothetical protein n=1 Tax=unclassified Streptomyces TaxID=2593676 RepID=UPI00378B3988
MSATRTCGWCGRGTREYLVHEIDADHGPAEVVWCRDWRACRAAARRNVGVRARGF